MIWKKPRCQWQRSYIFRSGEYKEITDLRTLGWPIQINRTFLNILKSRIINRGIYRITSNCGRGFYLLRLHSAPASYFLRLFRMFKKVPLIWMGHPNVRRSVISWYSPLRKVNDRCHWQQGFVLLIHIFHIIPQVVRSFNAMESHCNLTSASNGLLCNTWNFKVLFPWRTDFS